MQDAVRRHPSRPPSRASRKPSSTNVTPSTLNTCPPASIEAVAIKGSQERARRGGEAFARRRRKSLTALPRAGAPGAPLTSHQPLDTKHPTSTHENIAGEATERGAGALAHTRARERIAQCRGFSLGGRARAACRRAHEADPTGALAGAINPTRAARTCMLRRGVAGGRGWARRRSARRAALLLRTLAP